MTDFPKVSIILQCGGEGYLRRLQNCLKALKLHDYLGEVETVLTYVGELEEEIPVESLRRLGVDVLNIRRNIFAEWPTAWARNVGFRVSSGEILVSLDVDVLMRSDMLSLLVRKALKGAMVWVQGTRPDEHFMDYNVDDPTLWKRAKTEGHHLTRCRGALAFAVPREAVFAIQGQDECFVGYGSEDVDFTERLLRYGLREESIVEDESASKFIHQWHNPRRAQSRRTLSRNRVILDSNNAANKVVTGNESWGLTYDGFVALDPPEKKIKIDYGGLVVSSRIGSCMSGVMLRDLEVSNYYDSPKNRIFQIGFNRCGTTSIAVFFRRHGFKTIHWGRGFLAALMELAYFEGRPLLTYVGSYDVYTDIECTTRDSRLFVHCPDEELKSRLAGIKKRLPVCMWRRYALLDKQYPNSKFILNVRDVDKWILSRTHHADGFYQTCAHGDNVHKEAEDLCKCWRVEWYSHIERVQEYFKSKPSQLLVFDIEKDDPRRLVDFLPEHDLNPRYWSHENKWRGTNGA